MIKVSNPKIGITTGYLWKNGYCMLRDFYVKSIEKAGGLPFMIPPIIGREKVEDLLEFFDGILLSGGSDVDPKLYNDRPSVTTKIGPFRDEFEIELIKKAVEKKKPILAICRGIQILNVALGGSLIQEVQKVSAIKHYWVSSGDVEIPWWLDTHTVEIKRGTLLEKIFGVKELSVNSFHHQAVKNLGEGLVISAFAPDNIIEAIEHIEHPFCVGVQWHPEGMIDVHKEQLKLFEAFVNAAKGQAL